ncbi:MAG: Smr/MutS family protein [Bacteroidota bacterium]|nr:Smr/MutS family protein [Bacteroidota bacterium]MDX5506911.1 Smr/MutS family protein [Bacteroidota bacterium]
MKPGDQISFLDDVGGGVILEVKQSEALILREDGFEEWHPLASLILRGDFSDSIGSIPMHKDLDREVIRQEPEEDRSKKRKVMEVDLHYGHLSGRSDRLATAHEKLTLQLDHARSMMERARKKKYTHVVFIHGVGKGKLRDELHKWLNAQSRCEFYDASFRDYGRGATEVRIW